MKPEIKARWVAALRSGEYRQGKELLRIPDGILGPSFCCLGVPCEVARQDGIVSYDPDGHYYSVADPEDGSDASLPEAVLVWADLPRGDKATREIRVPGTADSPPPGSFFTTLNDQLDYTFEMIAEEVERRL